MRILILAAFADSIIQFRGELIKALLARNVEVHIAAPNLSTTPGIANTLLESGVTVHDIVLNRGSTNPFQDLITFCSILRKISAIKPDMVFAYTIKPVIYGMLAAKVFNVPKRIALVTGLGFAFQGDGNRNKLQVLVEGLYRFALAGCDMVFFQNPDDRALFHSKKIISVSSHTTIVNGSGINITEFSIKPIHTNPTVFLMIARLLGDKGVREYAAAAKHVKQRFPHVIFQLVGWIDESPDAIEESELNRWVEEGTLEFLGRKEDVRSTIEACSVYVLPSYREGTPRTVLEAMAMGRPVITTDVPGCRETVVDGDNGFLIPVKSVNALAEAMFRFIEQPAQIARMGARARKITEDKYDVHKVNAVMLDAMAVR
jgi:glycosyltransferase involved in cell wall biosynthesis